MDLQIKQFSKPQPEVLHFCYMISENPRNQTLEFFVDNPIDHNKTIKTIGWEDLEEVRRVDSDLQLTVYDYREPNRGIYANTDKKN